MKLYEQIKDDVAPISSDDGQAVINNDETHVSLLWEDGEITSTKSGDLFGARSLHQSVEPWLPRNEQLWSVPESPDNPFTSDHHAKVILDRDAVTDAMSEYAEAHNIHVRGRL